MLVFKISGGFDQLSILGVVAKLDSRIRYLCLFCSVSFPLVVTNNGQLGCFVLPFFFSHFFFFFTARCEWIFSFIFFDLQKPSYPNSQIWFSIVQYNFGEKQKKTNFLKGYSNHSFVILFHWIAQGNTFFFLYIHFFYSHCLSLFILVSLIWYFLQLGSVNHPF